MRMYPAYRLRDVLGEYAITFFALLNEGYRLQNKHYLMLAQLGDLPHMDSKNRINFYKQLEWASTPPSDILKTNGEGSSPAEIKKILQG